MEAFGNSRKPKKRRVKRQTTNDDKCDGGEASLGGDQVDKAMAYMLSTDRRVEEDAERRRVEAREERRDQEKNPKSARENREFQERKFMLLLVSQNRNQDTPQSRMTVIATVRCCCRCGFSSQNAELNFCTVCNGEMK
jgi:hypothetical protein